MVQSIYYYYAYGWTAGNERGKILWKHAEFIASVATPTHSTRTHHFNLSRINFLKKKNHNTLIFSLKPLLHTTLGDKYVSNTTKKFLYTKDLNFNRTPGVIIRRIVFVDQIRYSHTWNRNITFCSRVWRW